jgi:hypothetical protein
MSYHRSHRSFFAATGEESNMAGFIKSKTGWSVSPINGERQIGRTQVPCSPLHTNATVTMMIGAMRQNHLSYNLPNQQSQYLKSG